MPDLYQQAQAFRAALLRRDNAALAAITEAYGQAYSRLLRQLADLLNQIAARRAQGLPDNPAWLAKSARYNQLLRDIDKEFQRFGLNTGQLVRARQADEFQRGVRDAATLTQTGIQNAPRLSVQFDKLAPAAVEQMIGALQDSTPLVKLFDEIAPLAVTQAKDTLTNAVVQGWSPRKAAAELRRALGIPLNRALTIARTETIRAYREAAREQYQANDDIIKGWRWIASKSLRTCLNCLSRDGRIYPLEKPLPQHPNCRCTLSPVLIGADDAANYQTGTEWFNALPDDQQRQMMSGKAFELYKAGDITLQDFEGEKKSRKWGVSTYERNVKEILADR